jgi:hypothetical protein
VEPGCGGREEEGERYEREIFRGSSSGRGKVETVEPFLRAVCGCARGAATRITGQRMSSNRRRREAPAPPDKWGLGPWIFYFR